MPIPAEFVEALLQRLQVHPELGLQSEKLKEIFGENRHRRRSAAPPQAEKEVPQPQLFVACGFSNTKPEWISESFQSSVIPSRNRMLFGSMKTFTSSKLKTLSVARGLGSNLNW